MTDRISTDELRHASLARRFYHHALHGGTLTAGDVSIMVQSIEKLEAEVIRLREAYAEGYKDGFKKSGWSEMDRQELARAALNHKETE